MRGKPVLWISGSLLLAGCHIETGAPAGRERLTQEIRPLHGHAPEGDLRFDFVAGELELRADPTVALLEVGSEFDRAGLRPLLVEEPDEEGRFDLRLRHENPELGFMDDYENVHNRWDVRLGVGNRLDLTFDVTASRANLDLSGLELRNLHVDASAGRLDLGFDRPNPIAMERLRIEIAAGEGALRGLGHAHARALDLEVAAGSLTVDLRGDWQESARIRLDLGVGEVKIILPRDVGVSVSAEVTLGTLDTGVLQRRGDRWVSSASDRREIELVIDIEAAIGSVDLVYLD
jgi:hypothetical protein